ncbi:MAG: lytic murein transglycosylase [Pseudomonadota bacterium]
MKRLAIAAACALLATPASASFSACVNGLKASTVQAGVSRKTVNAALSDVARDEKVLRFSRAQPEYKTPIWDYMAFLVDDDRIRTGRKMMKKHGSTLKAVERTYGVDRYVIAALWGVESNYGENQGSFFIPHALANLACSGRRTKFWRGELVSALKIVDRGDLRMKDLKGSWAGAFGQTQFIPSTYRRLAVDFDKDGRRDLVRSVPDALGSTANYLNRSGWRSGQAWGYEVRLPSGYSGPTGRKAKASVATWSKRGLKKAGGGKLTGSGTAGLLVPAGRNGPAFLVFRNFDAIYSYNLAESYALAISHLSDRLRGGKEFRTAWPTNDLGLSREQRLDLQKRLNKRGFDVGEADGKVGPATRAGIRKAEAALGLPVTGRPGMKVYRALGGKI